MDEIVPERNVIYLMDKTYLDFEALYRINQADAFFVTRAKKPMKYEVVKQNFNIDQTTGLRTYRTVKLTIQKSKGLYPKNYVWLSITTIKTMNYLFS